MNLSKLIDFKSKTFWGVLLGVLGILLSATELYTDLPPTVARIVQVIGFVIVSMGVRDAMLEQQAALIKKLVDIKSKTFWGALIQGVVYILDNPDTLPIPPEYATPLRIVAVVFQAMGWRDAAKRSKLS